jgi:hypothetical protein
MLGRKTGGRQKGTPNRVSATARDNIIRAFDDLGGVPALVEWAKANRADFYRIYARLLPVESHIGGADGGAVEVDLAGGKEKLLQMLLPEIYTAGGTRDNAAALGE